MFTEEATAVAGGALACWQSSEGWTGALLVNKARRHSRRKSWWDPRGGHEKQRITSVVSSPRGLWLCSGKFLMSEPETPSWKWCVCVGVKDVDRSEPGRAHMMIPAMYVSPEYSCLAA